MCTNDHRTVIIRNSLMPVYCPREVKRGPDSQLTCPFASLRSLVRESYINFVASVGASRERIPIAHLCLKVMGSNKTIYKCILPKALFTSSVPISKPRYSSNLLYWHWRQLATKGKCIMLKVPHALKQ